MSLFNVPELDDLVGTHLTSRDLTACVLVNKTWNNFFTPRLWRTVVRPFARGGRRRRCYHRSSFCRMVLSDYLLATQQQQEHHQEDEYSHNRPVWADALTRNGRWVRELSVGDHDFLPPQSSSTSTLPPSETSLPAAPDVVNATAAAVASVVASAPVPTNGELLYHLLKRCTNIQQLDLLAYISTPQSQDFWCDLIQTGLPTTTIIDLKLSIETNCKELSFTPVPFIQGSTVLKKLALQLYCKHHPYLPHYWRGKPEAGGTKQEAKVAEEDNDEEEGLLPSLKELSVTYDAIYPYFSTSRYPRPPIWPRLLRRCPNLESLYTNTSDHHWIQAMQACVSLRSLEIKILKPDSCRLLATAIKTYLPNLDTINIHAEGSQLTDEDKASVISARRKGWRSIELVKAGPFTIQAVVKHCSTLEVLNLRKARGLTSELMVQLLSSSPRLETFVTLVEDDYGYYGRNMGSNQEYTHLLAEDFIDADAADPSSDSLRSWACESTLKVFRAKITGIPRPDITKTYSGEPLKEGMVLPEAYPGQSLDLQGRVYERLARLTRLERLELGHEDRYLDPDFRDYWSGKEKNDFDDMNYQYACLEMSLKSGLRRLERLKGLRVLSVVRMATKIGVEEVQWMSQSWPKLTMIDGLDVDGLEEEADKWLHNASPTILSVPCIRFY
ncbi:hypothetical protein BKA57DRAFT_453979 [Linnemannia elongata]|nr:hypothetical protein BKA57DRAFT_453979 [Linnemannia elongata]